MKKLIIFFIILITTESQSMHQLTTTPTDIQKLENEIKRKYNLTQIHCYSALSKYNTKEQLTHRAMKANMLYSIDNDALACVAVGFKKILFNYVNAVKNIDPEIKKLLKAKHIKEIRFIIPDEFDETIIYTPDEEHNALLIAKLPLELLEEKDSGDYKTYAIGILLDYEPEDVEFFFKRIAFIEKYPELTKNLPNAHLYSEWPDQVKEKFSEFEDQWDAGKIIDAIEFQNSKAQAEQWIAKNRQLSTSQLIQHIEQWIKEEKGSFQIKEY